MDIDGSGMVDLVTLAVSPSGLQASAFLSMGHSLVRVSTRIIQPCFWFSCLEPLFLPMDVNGDGKADLVRRWNNNGVAWAEVHLSNGTGFVPAWNERVFGSDPCSSSHDCGAAELAMDVNGDRKTDLVRIGNLYGKAWPIIKLSTGRGF
jgi:hypothetical protein